MNKNGLFANQMCADPELLTLRLIPFFMALIMCSFVSYLSRKLTQFEQKSLAFQAIIKNDLKS